MSKHRKTILQLKINTINQLSQEIYERHLHSHTIKAQIGGFTKSSSVEIFYELCYRVGQSC